MKRPRLDISPGAAILAAAVFYLARPEELLAVALPVLAHELGHMAAMAALGLELRCIRAGLDGFILDYAGETGAAGRILTAAAGPLAGLLYALTTSALGKRLDVDWLCLSAGVSLLLSLFNLLPALPLDGGRITEALAASLWGERRAESLCGVLRLAVAVTLLAAGTVLLCQKKGGALLLAGFWLLWNALEVLPFFHRKP